MAKNTPKSKEKTKVILLLVWLCLAALLCACGSAPAVSEQTPPAQSESVAQSKETPAQEPDAPQSEPVAEKENIWEQMSFEAVLPQETPALQELSTAFEYGTAVMLDGELRLSEGTAPGEKLCDAPEGMFRLEDSMVNAEGTVALYAAQGTLWYQLLSVPESAPQRIAAQVESYTASADARYVFYTLPQETGDADSGALQQLFRFDTKTGETVQIATAATGIRWNAGNRCRFAPDPAQRRIDVMDGTVTVVSMDGQAAYWIGMHGDEGGIWAWRADAGTVRLCSDYVRNTLFLDEDSGGIWYPGDDGGLYHWRGGKTEKITEDAARIFYGNAAGQACYTVATGKISLLDAVEPDDPDSPLLKELEELCTGQQYTPSGLNDIYYTDGTQTGLLAKDVVSIRMLGNAVLLVGQQRWDFTTVKVSAYDTLDALLEDAEEPQRYTDPLLICGGSVFVPPADAEIVRGNILEDGRLELWMARYGQDEDRYAYVIWQGAENGLRYVSHTELSSGEYLTGVNPEARG